MSPHSEVVTVRTNYAQNQAASGSVIAIISQITHKRGAYHLPKGNNPLIPTPSYSPETRAWTFLRFAAEKVQKTGQQRASAQR